MGKNGLKKLESPGFEVKTWQKVGFVGFSSAYKAVFDSKNWL